MQAPGYAGGHDFDEAKGQGAESGEEIFIPIDTLDDKLALEVVVKANDKS